MKTSYYEYMMRVADIVSHRYGQHGTAEKIRALAGERGLEPDEVEALNAAHRAEQNALTD